MQYAIYTKLHILHITYFSFITELLETMLYRSNLIMFMCKYLLDKLLNCEFLPIRIILCFEMNDIKKIKKSLFIQFY